MEELASVENPALRSSAVRAVVETMATIDSPAAFEWAASLENSKERSDSLVRAMELTAQRDPAAALDRLDLLKSKRYWR